jgi:hypothetical protein
VYADEYCEIGYGRECVNASECEGECECEGEGGGFSYFAPTTRFAITACCTFWWGLILYK